ncbi:MAG: DNA topoisomerase (ATP-hydrolyzing) subunit B [Candidatus Micrarchaeota archaeon]
MEKSNGKDLKRAETDGGGQNSSYGAKDIQVLEGLEAVRKRPAMYIGDKGARGLHHLAYEVVDNSIDEALAGHCKEIKVQIKGDGSVCVEDDGRGIPSELHEQTGKSALEVVMTVLHAGGKFDNKTYKVSGGLHGVGVSVVNALSEWLEARVKRDGKEYFQKYIRGRPVAPAKEIGKSELTGTSICFKPDSEIFETIEFKYDTLANRLRELAYLNKGVRIVLSDEKTKKTDIFHFSGGIIEFVSHVNKNKTALHPVIYFEKQSGAVSCEVAIQYSDSYVDNIFTYVNSIHTIEGGTHLAGFRSALTKTVNDYARKNKLLKEGSISGDDIQEGISAVISLRIPNPQFEGQTKTKLGNTEMKGIVESIVRDMLSAYLEEHPADARAILMKGINAMRAREAAQKAKDLIRRKGILESTVLPGKLADCADENPENCELFITEGDSAGGCFSGDTKVALVDGRIVSFKQLVKEDKKGKKNYCYTIKEDGSIGIVLIRHPRLTKKKIEVVKVVLDNNEEIICTKDHEFMLRDGTYAEAQNIQKGTSLMPLSRKLSKREGRITISGYEMVYDPKQHKWIFTHMLSDKYNLENGKYSVSSGAHKHYIDFNKLNNNPENIARMSKEEHLRLHAEILEKTLFRDDVKKKSIEARRRPEYRKKISKLMSTPKMKKMLSKRAKKQWKDEEYKKYMIKKYLEFYESNEDYRKASLERLDRLQREYWADEKHRKAQSERIRKYFEKHPSRKKELSEISKRQWSDLKLLKWRSSKTKEQWTGEFRKKIKVASNKRHFDCTISFMKKIIEKYGNLDKYDEERIKLRNKKLLKLRTFTDKFFVGDKIAMLDAVRSYNHKVVKVISIDKRMDVYDLEVEETHNFALASGIFVHNSAKQGRDRKIQAILPLRGKILNVEKASISKILQNAEIRNLIMAIGTNFGAEFDVSKLRYHKIVIMTDADVDGAHIRTLLLTFFYRYLKPLVELGHIYIAQPPLYRLKAGNKQIYVYDDAQLGEVLKEWGNPKNYQLQRYKGLGEMNPSQLWETTMNPKVRTLLKITIEDAMHADELFTILMGEVVEPRKEFIQAHAKEAQNIDI